MKRNAGSQNFILFNLPSYLIWKKTQPPLKNESKEELRIDQNCTSLAQKFVRIATKGKLENFIPFI